MKKINARCENCNTCVWTHNKTLITTHWLIKLEDRKQGKINVKAHPNSIDSATIFFHCGRIISIDDFCNGSNVTSIAAAVDAQQITTAVKCVDTDDCVKHHIQWRPIAAANLFKYASIDTFLPRIISHKVSAEWTCTAHVYTSARLIIKQSAISVKKLQQSQSQ